MEITQTTFSNSQMDQLFHTETEILEEVNQLKSVVTMQVSESSQEESMMMFQEETTVV